MSAAVVIVEAPAPEARRQSGAGLFPLIRSLLINLAGPYLLYRLVEGHFPHGSVAPLLISALVPAAELAAGLVRKRTVDVISIISLAQLSISMAISLIAHSALAAVLGHALQPAGLGLVFGLSLLTGRPLIQSLARLTLAGDDPERRARFDAAAASSGARRSFTLLTVVWMLALGLESVVLATAAFHLATSTYLLASNMISLGVWAVLIAGSLRYGRRASRRTVSPGPVPAPAP